MPQAANPADDPDTAATDAPASVSDSPLVSETLLLKAGEGVPVRPAEDAVAAQAAEASPPSPRPSDDWGTAFQAAIGNASPQEAEAAGNESEVMVPDSSADDLLDLAAGASAVQKPPASATADPGGYASQLQEMTSDQVLDEFSRQDQPELRQAVVEELRTRLHSGGVAADAGAGEEVPGE